MREFLKDAIWAIIVGLLFLLSLSWWFKTTQEAGFLIFPILVGFILFFGFILVAFGIFNKKGQSSTIYQTHTTRNLLIVLIPLVTLTLIIWVLSTI